MSYIYEIVSGKLYQADGALIAIGYSGGDGGQEPDAVNNPARIREHNVGPIPPGNYVIQAPADDTHTGPFSLPLTPDPANDMYGRDGFRMHGDNNKMNKSASDGCIIMPRNIREEVWLSGDRDLTVVSYMEGNDEPTVA